MQNVRSIAAALALATVVAGVSAPSARADLKVVQSVTFDSPQMKQMLANIPPARRAAMAKSGQGMFDGKPIIATVSNSGQKFRSEMGPQIVLLDGAAKKMTMLNTTGHTYQTMPYNPGANTPAANMSASVHDTGQTKTILGHLARHYTINVSAPMMGGATIKGDIWAAPDLPQPPIVGPATGPGALIQAQMKAIKGMPLITTIKINGGQMGMGMTIKSVVKSISTAKLPASLFAIPAGYSEGAMPMGMGGMGR
jgi:hypothetical protein